MGELSALGKSFRYAARGICHSVMTQRNLRIHLTAAAAAAVFGSMAQLPPELWCAVILCCMLVISLELVNTALEALADRVSRETHPLIGQAKDAAAGAVLISAIGSVVIWVLIFRQADYFMNVVRVLRTAHWVKYALAGAFAAALVFIFLPSVLQKRKKA